MKICCIDVGTNSVLSLLARIDKKKRFTPLEFHSETTRLGKSLRTAGILAKKSQNGTISAIKKHLKDADRYIIAGTGALREAKNRDEFINKLYKETGLKLKVLSGNEEAKLVFTSARHFISPFPKEAVVCDVGGGSTEFIFCRSKNILKKVSMPVGAVNLTERFGGNISEMEYFIKSKFSPLFRKAKTLIVVGGTVTTLGAINKGLNKYDPEKVHGSTLSYKKVVYLLEKLKSLSLARRKKLIRFDPKRADIIIAGACILKAVMELFNLDKIKICDRGLVYGLALVYSK